MSSHLVPRSSSLPSRRATFFRSAFLRSLWNGALERFYQSGDSREDRAVVGGEPGVTILQPAFDGSVRRDWSLKSWTFG